MRQLLLYSIIEQPFLLLALDDYLLDPSQDCLARLFDAVNSMDLSDAPKLTRHEKLVMRSSERKDIFAEKFSHINSQPLAPVPGSKSIMQHKSSNSGDSQSSFDGLLLRGKGKKENQRRDRLDSDPKAPPPQERHNQDSPSDSSFSLGGSAVWVGDESAFDLIPKEAGDASSVTSMVTGPTLIGSSRDRRSIDASSSSSLTHGREYNNNKPQNPQLDFQKRHGVVKDTHFYHTTVPYKDFHLPINMPLSTFPEEVGDVCSSFGFKCYISVR